MKKTEDIKTEAKVEGLKEKMIYQFRVKAYNKAGVGDASEPTENHLCKHRNCKFFFYQAFSALKVFISSFYNSASVLQPIIIPTLV